MSTFCQIVTVGYEVAGIAGGVWVLWKLVVDPWGES